MFGRFYPPICGLLVLIGIMLFGEFMLQRIFPDYWEIVEFGLTKIYVFPIGMYLGYLSKKGYNVSIFYLIIFLLCCSLFLFCGIMPEAMKALIGIPIVCLLFEKLFNNNNCNWLKRLLVWLGKLSLEIYLLHVLINFALKDVFGVNHSWSMVIGICLGLMLCAPCSRIIKRLMPE